MDTTSKTAAEIFNDQLSALELLFDLKFDGDTPGARIEELGRIARTNPDLTASVTSFFSNPSHFAKKFKRSEGTLFEAVTKTIFAVAARGAVHSYGPAGAPRRQHWIPFTYLKNFRARDVGKVRHGRALPIPGVNFAEGRVLDFDTTDSNFIHPRVNGAGFYEDGAEFFFCLIEGLYAQGKLQSAQNDLGSCALVTVFFFAQSVRNPRHGESFVHSSLGSIVDAILANIDAVGPKMEGRFLRSNRGQLPFTPFVPPFVDRLNGKRVYSLPISLRTLFSLSSGELTEEHWDSAPFRYRRGVVQQAKRRGSYIFGVHSDKIQDLI